MIRRWLHAALVVSDLERSKSFYEKLGFTVVREQYLTNPTGWAKLGLTPGRMRYAIMQLKDETGMPKSDSLSDYAGPVLDLAQPMNPPPAAGNSQTVTSIGLQRLSFEVDDIDLAYSTLKEMGAHFLGPVGTVPLASGNMHMFVVEDPDGIFIEIGGPRKS